MAESEYPLKYFSIGGYRSFGDKIQRFEKFSKINLFIGQNNSGKSNILKFIHDLYPRLCESGPLNLDPLDRHFPTGAGFVAGLPISLHKDEVGNHTDFIEAISPKFKKDFPENYIKIWIDRVFKVFLEKAKISNTPNMIWFDFDQGMKLAPDYWEDAFSVLSDGELENLWGGLTNQSDGNRKENWFPESLQRLKPSFPYVETVLIPAIRQIGEQGSISEDFSGEGIIERLVKLQNPDVHNQADREKFDRINSFLQNVTDNKTARIEIPHERDTILVHMDGKTLPLESLGTGIHEVIILSSASTILDGTAICMEEPELHLNPILQKKLVRYLQSNTNNQYFISTHSAALMDTPKAEIYHVNLVDGQSIARHATSNRQRSAVCEDLGYHPSDLLQSNCIIWVEGPSDRIYLNFWISGFAPQYIEGIHYSIMFYGGRLAAHLSGNDANGLLDDFISLRTINRRAVVVIDSDKRKKGGRINATKRRLRDEFEQGPGFTWITEGREIENYIIREQLEEAIQIIKPSAKATSRFGKYENNLSIKTKGGKRSQAPKVNIAKYIVSNFERDYTPLNLTKQMRRLIAFIDESNPALHASVISP